MAILVETIEGGNNQEIPEEALVPPRRTAVLVMDRDSFSVDVPPVGKGSIQYAPDNVDLLRYRLGKSRTHTGESTPNQPGQAYAIEDLKPDPSYPINSFYPHTKKEIITIKAIERTGFFAEERTNTTNGRSPSENWLNSIDVSLADPPANPTTIEPIFGSGFQNSVSDKIFFDHVTGFVAPMETRDLDRLDNAAKQGIPLLDISVKYNYYQKAYEFVSSEIQNPGFGYSVPEILLPNYYAYEIIRGNAQLNGRNTVSPFRRFETEANYINLQKLLTLDGEISLPSIYGGTAIYQDSPEKGNYFDEYAYKIAEQIRGPGGLSSYGSFAAVFRSQVINPQDFKDLMIENGSQDRFPMYTKLTFSSQDQRETIVDADNDGTPEMVNFAQKFTASPFLKNFVEDVAGIDYGEPLPPEAVQYSNYPDPRRMRVSLPFNLSGTAGYPPFVPDNVNSGVQEIENLDVLDFDWWMSNRALMSVPEFTARNPRQRSILLGNELDDTSPSSIQENAIVQDLFDQAKAANTRNYKDILDGFRAHRQILFFKVEKWDVDANGNPKSISPNKPLPNQSFYLPYSADFQTTKFDFFDTQIKYGKTYIYRVYAYYLVFGTQYYYQSGMTQDQLTDIRNEMNTQDKFESDICVFTSPSAKVIGMPFYQETVSVADRPPVSPQINIKSYYGVKDRLLFLLNGNVGNDFEQPIVIKDSDKAKFDSIRKALQLQPYQKLNFFSDDPVTSFEVFKLDVKPTSYRDFSLGDSVMVDAGDFSDPCKAASSAAFVDQIEPNQKYYYIFRSIDIHGNISNPSPIYEVEISYDGASPFLLTKLIDVAPLKKPLQEPTKKLKKYLRIRPAYAQTLLNEAKSGLVDEITGDPISPSVKEQDASWQPYLGTNDEHIWSGNKTFKIRIVSNKTGKKIDLKLKFDLKNITLENTIDNKLC
jgi:hypothetical protein